MRILFVCLAGQRRSRTAMELFQERFPELEFDCCGASFLAVEKSREHMWKGNKVCTQQLIDEADRVIFMDATCHMLVNEQLNIPAYKIVRWEIQDIYNYNVTPLKNAIMHCLWSGCANP
jgi:protein-tyrosine-phosphatase